MLSIEKIKWRDLGVRRVTVPPTLWHTISDVLEVEEMTELGKAVYERQPAVFLPC